MNSVKLLGVQLAISHAKEPAGDRMNRVGRFSDHVNPCLRVMMLLCLMVLCPSDGTFAGAPQRLLFFEDDRVPGGIALVELGPADGPLPSVSWNDQPIAVISNDGKLTAIVGVPLSTQPGEHKLKVTHADNRSRIATFEITPFEYREQRITITNKRKVNPYAKDMTRIRKESKRLKVIKTSRADRLLASTFDWPVSGPLSSPFGLKRFFNDQPRRPHGGIDVAAPEGTPVVAPAEGLVIETGDYFFNGQSVFIEHGLGLQTFYAHLSRIDVKPGQRVSKGDVIGAVGATGRVTGPHLHWSVGLNGTWINPLLVLDSDTPPTD